jgi:hypothetical protein
MNIEAGAMLSTTDGAQYADAKERLLLGILRIIEKAGAKLAHPTQRVELVSSPPRERALAAASSNQNGSSSPGHSRPG